MKMIEFLTFFFDLQQNDFCPLQCDYSVVTENIKFSYYLIVSPTSP